jgi:imidazole glycerol-phosphate synthase subunit HisH
MITIVDYGTSNVASVQNMLRKLGFSSIITSTRKDIENAQTIILPGVGLFDAAMNNLENLGLVETLQYKAKIEKVPFLGICLGMQLLGDSSEEGEKCGLGLIKSRSKKFSFPENKKLKVPHMGWNAAITQKSSELFAGYDEQPYFYFVHSYHVVCEESADVLAQANYGIQFTASVQRENVSGVQFHPEKSHKFGMQLLRNFVEHASSLNEISVGAV